MENIRKFNTEQEYAYASVGNADIVSYITDCDCVKFNSGAFVLSFETSNEEVTIVPNGSICAKVIVEGIKKPVTSGVMTHTFSTAGKHEVKVWLKDINDTAEAFTTLPNLVEAIVPHTCNTIGAKMFYRCAKLKRVILHSGVIHFGANAFNGCSTLDKVKLYDAATHIDNNALEGTAIEKFTIPANVDSVGKKAFQNCANLKKVVISSKTLDMGEYVFDGCINVSEIVCESKSAPGVTVNTFSNIGANAQNKTLVIPQGSTGYTTGHWAVLIQNGFVVKEV